MSDTVSVETVASAIDALRDQVPLVQSLTNIVSANFLTNVLLAAGASTLTSTTFTKPVGSLPSPGECSSTSGRRTTGLPKPS